MILRSSKDGRKFYGCRSFPRCRGTRPADGDGKTTFGKGRAMANPLGVKARTRTLIPGSPQQEAIWRAMLDPDGPHICVDACPGSGKSFTALQAALRLPSTLNIGILAFNRHIRAEMESRLAANGISNARAITLNSLGWTAVRRRWPNVELNGHKLPDIADQLMAAEKQLDGYSPDNRAEVRNVMVKAVGLCRAFLLDISDRDQLDWVAGEYALDADVPARAGDPESEEETTVSGTEIALRLAPALASQAWGMRDCVVDYDDQIWLPVVERLAVETFDMLMIDEVQDLTVAQLELALRACPSGRITVLGDTRQCCYNFRGVDLDAVEHAIASLESTARGCITLPMTLTRRCPRLHVELALGIYDHIEALPEAPDGIVRSGVDWQRACDEMRSGDMVICRVNRFLIPVAYQLTRMGKKAVIRGRDIGDGIAALVKKLKTKEVRDVGDLLDKLLTYHEKEAGKLRRLGFKGQSRLASLEDRCETLVELCDGVYTIPDLLGKIKALFADFDEQGKPNNAVILSTIHAGKGAESFRVWILAPELIPHPRATTAREYTSELNLAWVLSTRAKFDRDHPGEIVFVKGPDKKSTGQIPEIFRWEERRAAEREREQAAAATADYPPWENPPAAPAARPRIGSLAQYLHGPDPPWDGDDNG